jgi:hypothetical protein
MDSDPINVILDAATPIELEQQSRQKSNQSLTKIQQPPKSSKKQKDQTISNEHLHKKDLALVEGVRSLGLKDVEVVVY